MHLTRLRFITVINMVATAMVAACTAGSPAHQAGATPFRVALLTPGPISDQSWNAGAYQGLLRIRDSLDAQISNIETKTPAEFEDNFRQYGAQGYNLVIGHGFEFQDAARRVAPDFPHTVFLTTSQSAASPNLAGLAFDFANPSYLAGMIAGAITHTNTVGVVGGTELPPVRESFAAFARGALHTNPHVKIITSYIGNWDDVSAGREQALAQIARGVDVIFQNADAAGLGVFQAARQSPHVYVFGSNSNQNGVAPDVTVGSVVINLPHAFLAVAREVKAGTFRARVFSMGMREDVVTLVLNPRFEPRLPPGLLARVDSVRAQMLQGAYSAVDTARPSLP